MSFRVGNVAVIAEEEDDECELCGKFDELRPYGPKGERICHDCAMKDPKGTEERMGRILFGERPAQ